MNSTPDHTPRPEFEIVVAASQTTFGAEARQQVERLATRDPDWDRVVRMAAYHGVHPLVGQNLDCIDAVPPDVLARLHGSMVRTAASNLVQIKELVRLRRLLEAENLRMIAFKGPILAAEVYNNLGLRPSTDLDILIESDRYDEVTRVLSEDGYTQVVRRGASNMAQSAHRYLSQQVPFVKRGNFAIDVHLNVMPPGYYYAFSFETLFARSHTVTVADTNVRGFGSEDLLQVLCYHGVKNRYERLKHICDISELIATFPNLDWDTVLRRARRTRGEGVLNLGLYMTYLYFKCEFPPEIERRFLADERAIRFGKWLFNRMPHNIDRGMPDFGQRFRLYLGVQDTLVNKARYCIYSALRRLE